MKYIPLILILLLGFAVRVYKLDSIPGEMWGDVIEHYKLITSIRAGDNVISTWWGSDGPIFPYLAALVSQFIGLTFITFKLTSVIIGGLGILAEYLMVKAITKNQRVAILAALLMAISFWSITFSRHAKGFILAPLMITLATWALAEKKWVRAGIFLGLGLFSQASSWGSLGFIFYNWITGGLWVIFGLMLLYNQRQILLNQHSYVSGKFFENNLSFWQKIQQAGTNFVLNMRALVYRGENGFRYKVPDYPYLDPISSIFLVIGLGSALYLGFKRKRREYLWYGILPIIFLQAPAVLDISNPGSSPNMGRLLVISPFIYLLIAMGINQTVQLITKPKLRNIVIGFCVGLIGLINAGVYFYSYPKFLPNGNVPFGKIIAEYVNKNVPDDMPVVLAHCCWGEWGQPEPNGIQFLLNNQSRFYHWEWLPEQSKPDLSYIPQNHEVILISKPNLEEKQRVEEYFTIHDLQVVRENGWEVAYLMRGILKR